MKADRLTLTAHLEGHGIRVEGIERDDELIEAHGHLHPGDPEVFDRHMFGLYRFGEEA